MAFFLFYRYKINNVSFVYITPQISFLVFFCTTEIKGILIFLTCDLEGWEGASRGWSRAAEGRGHSLSLSHTLSHTHSH